jgi:hypothetical protein
MLLHTTSSPKPAKSITDHFDNQIQTFLRRYTTSAADYETICFEFESFRAQEPPFEYGRRCWTLVTHPKLFWHSTFSHTKLLGKLAYRLFCTPVNSVASERAFSVQNYIHSKTRNALHPERTDKLVYLYINGRRVSQFENLFANAVKSKPIRDLTEDDEVELENILIMGEGVCLESISDVNDEREEIAEEDSEDEESNDDDDGW